MFSTRDQIVAGAKKTFKTFRMKAQMQEKSLGNVKNLWTKPCVHAKLQKICTKFMYTRVDAHAPAETHAHRHTELHRQEELYRDAHKCTHRCAQLCAHMHTRVQKSLQMQKKENTEQCVMKACVIYRECETKNYTYNYTLLYMYTDKYKKMYEFCESQLLWYRCFLA